MKLTDFKLSVEQLRNACCHRYEFDNTEELDPLEGMIGQERGMRALDFGMHMRGEHYNAFVLGPKSSGRNTAVRKVLKDASAERETPDDWCYVNNFEEKHKPIAVNLPAGKGRAFREDMEDLVKEMMHQLQQTFESEGFQRRRDQIGQAFQEKQNEEFNRLQDKAREAGFALQRSGPMFGIVPLKDGEPIDRDEYENLPDEEKQQMEGKGKEIRQELNEAMKKARKAEKEAVDAMRELERKAATMALGHAVDELREKYADFEKVVTYLDAVQEYVIDNVHDLLADDQEQQQGPLPQMGQATRERMMEKFEVNLVVDNSHCEGAPVVFEPNPTYANLIGRIEHRAQFGAMVTDFSMLKAGALQRANGGFLVLQARDLLTNYMAWNALKRCLKTRRIKMEDLNEQFRLITTVTLEPEAIPLNVKIVVVGEPFIYYLLYALDEDFSKFFKVKVDFDDQIDRNRDTENTYARFVSRVAAEHNLPPFDASAVGRIVEQSSRMVDDQKKLAATLGEVIEVVRESAYWAEKEGNEVVSRADVDKAVEEQIYRNSRIEDRLKELIERDIIMLDVKGKAVGQVNGMAVLQLGDYTFGKPSRITARAFSGRGGFMSIDREAKLSGRIHDKGIMILSGYLGEKYARNKPLCLSATISFEQQYSGIEGDSASSTELYVLLSAIGRIPLRQDIAVTGSVNQHGEIQPVGGVTHKIEGFFDVCRDKGLTGDQGVIIPRRNVDNLNLRPDVIQAVEDGKFHVYAIERIDEGILILTGMEAGEQQEDGTYPENTVNRKVDEALDEFAEVLKKYGGPGAPQNENGTEGEA